MIIQWIKKLLGISEPELTEFDEEHYNKFLTAVQQSDVVAYVYGASDKGPCIVLKGSQLHPVTAQNLVSFYKLNRKNRRKLNMSVDESGIG